MEPTCKIGLKGDCLRFVGTTSNKGETLDNPIKNST